MYCLVVFRFFRVTCCQGAGCFTYRTAWRSNWVFPKWILLNSINHDKVQKWYDYQEYPMTGIRYPFFVLSGDRHLPRGSKENVLTLLSLGMKLGSTSGNYNTFGFCNESLNLLHPVKFISGKPDYVRQEISFMKMKPLCIIVLFTSNQFKTSTNW